MQYVQYFDICAICIIVTIAVTSLSRRTVPAYRQRAYSFLIGAIFAASVAERIETFLQMNPQSAFWYHGAEMAAGSIYFISHLFSATTYFFYIMAVLDIYIDFRSLKNFLFCGLCVSVGFVLVAINFFYPILFYYSEDGLYHRGNLVEIYYILAFYYILGSIYLIMRYQRLIKKRVRIIIFSYVIFIFVGIAIQYFFPTILIENFCNTVSATLVYITLQNPSEMVDDSLNILNRKAFMDGLDLRIKRNAPHGIIFVTIDNIRALSLEIGYNQAQLVLKMIAKYLKSAGYKELRLQSYAYRYSEYVFAVSVQTKNAEAEKRFLEIIAQRLNDPWDCAGMTIRVEGHCFLMRFPWDYKNAPELMTKVDVITEELSHHKDIIVDVNDEVFEKIREAKDYDHMARITLDKKTAVIKYQPLLSKVYRINYCADVICFLTDENGNEIDVRKSIPDIKVTQALLDADEFVYRRACRALAFWNAGDKNGKYRAIVGLSQGEISRVDFVRRIKKILREEKAEASWISIKLTETTLTTMSKAAEHNIRIMGEMNSNIIVDKFGSGYGDLNRILSLPVSQVNLDISVLRMAAESEKMKIVAEGIVNLFHDVSIFVCASDIENEEDKKMAEEIGCDFLIGDYLGAPMRDSSYVKFIDAYFEEG